ncbi:MAG TPA: dihydropteroate synthase [Chryseolinea sp.]|nr:dihydropteroate synthase [Chryseolinea sp.]
MAVLNVTPDSFYDGGRYQTESAILNQVEKLLGEGATFIDVGAYSSRPGARDISVEEEIRRALFAVRTIIRNFPDSLLSIDTFRSEVAHAAVNEGACLVNDISAGEQDPKMFETVGRLNVPYIAMHMRGNPSTMTRLTEYENLLKEMVSYFQEKINHLQQLGIKDVIIDPGFGFAKTVEQNFYLLGHLDYFRLLGKPIAVGLSRKSMIWKTLSTSADNALNGTTSLNTIALIKGANILRVHDVKEAMEVIKLVSTFRNNNNIMEH